MRIRTYILIKISLFFILANVGRVLSFLRLDEREMRGKWVGKVKTRKDRIEEGSNIHLSHTLIDISISRQGGDFFGD